MNQRQNTPIKDSENTLSPAEKASIDKGLLDAKLGKMKPHLIAQKIYKAHQL